MIKRVLLMVAFCAVTSIARAQQPQVPGLSDIIPVIEQQRNQALSNHAVAQGRVSELTRENDALKAALAARDKKIAESAATLVDRDKKIADLENATRESAARVCVQTNVTAPQNSAE